MDNINTKIFHGRLKYFNSRLIEKFNFRYVISGQKKFIQTTVLGRDVFAV
jgi:hypothetical protein